MRAVLLQRLCFVQTVLQRSFATIFDDLVFNARKRVNVQRLREVMSFLEVYLRTTGFVCGTPFPTLADFSCLATYTTIEASHLVRVNEYPLSKSWAREMKCIVPGYDDANGNGIRAFRDYFSGLEFSTYVGGHDGDINDRNLIIKGSFWGYLTVAWKWIFLLLGKMFTWPTKQISPKLQCNIIFI